MVYCTHTVHIHCTTKDSEKQGIEQNDRNSYEQANGTLYTKYESNRLSVKVDDKRTVQHKNLVHVQTSSSAKKGMNCT